MKVLYDHQIFEKQAYGGISRYFYELMRHISSNTGIDYELSLKYSRNRYILDSCLFNNIKSIPMQNKIPGNISFPGKAKLHRMLKYAGFALNPEKENLMLSLQIIENKKYQIFHPTYYSDYFLNHLGAIPFVLTVYDMIHEKYMKMYKQYNDSTINKKRILALKAHKIIAISENTKRDIIDILDIDPKKIEVIYLANSLQNYNSSENIITQLPEKYFLYIGDRKTYKNFQLLVSAIAPIIQEEDIYLVCGGGKPFDKYECKLIRQCRCENRVLHYYGSDEILSFLYRHAIAFVFPSLYEGFGIPVLEAFSCNCPLLSSNTSSLPEVAGDAALYFDPFDVDSLRKALYDILNNPGLRNRLAAMGKKRLALFSWEKTSKETYEVYKSIL